MRSKIPAINVSHTAPSSEFCQDLFEALLLKQNTFPSLQSKQSTVNRINSIFPVILYSKMETSKAESDCENTRGNYPSCQKHARFTRSFVCNRKMMKDKSANLNPRHAHPANLSPATLVFRPPLSRFPRQTVNFRRYLRDRASSS